jgi:trk system potassium uptake protein TrkH
MAVHEPTLGYGLLFYRSLTQWIGGAGVIVLSLAIIPRPQIEGVLELYQSETAGMKVRPGILGTARAIWSVYLGLTLLAAAFLAAATFLFVSEMGLLEGVFHAVNHAMTGLATGGFSTLDDSISGYGSYAMEMAHLPPMLLGAIALPLHYKFIRGRRWGVLWRDPQFRLLCLMCAGGVPLVAVLLRGIPGVPDPIREGSFQFVSGLTGTGWQTSNIAAWTSAPLLVMAWCAMFVSGSAGSTVGGVKLIRAYLVGRAISRRVGSFFVPRGSVIPFRLGEHTLSAAEARREVADAASFCLLYAVILMTSVLVAAQVLGDQFSLGAIMFECSSAQGTVGLSAGITDPGMPVLVEALFILQMWVGRLEIFPVIILLTALCSRRGRG